MCDVGLAAGEKIIHTQHVRATGDQPITQMRAEKTGASRYQYFFHAPAFVQLRSKRAKIA